MIRGGISGVLFFSIVVFSSYISATQNIHYQANELVVSISIDSIQPGSISQKQVASLKELEITSGEKTYYAKSFDFAIMPKSGAAHIIKCFGNKIPTSCLIYLHTVKPGDFILVGNLVLFSNLKYKPLSNPMWTIVADAK